MYPHRIVTGAFPRGIDLAPDNTCGARSFAKIVLLTTRSVVPTISTPRIKHEGQVFLAAALPASLAILADIDLRTNHATSRNTHRARPANVLVVCARDAERALLLLLCFTKINFLFLIESSLLIACLCATQFGDLLSGLAQANGSSLVGTIHLGKRSSARKSHFAQVISNRL